jgi:4a-hydroxytetrahydrobiopterin dehydratase
MDLREQKCIPCQGEDPALTKVQIRKLLPQLPGWKIVERERIQRLERVFKFLDFKDSLIFTVKVGNLAEAEDHHPKLTTEWGKVTVTWWTHVIKGLHQNDFIMAAKTDLIYEG